jgi:alpha-N-arabinofuranosidase
MKKYLLLLFMAGQSVAFAQSNGSITITNDSKEIISRHIYGQFAEHLGRGIYDGFWVDKNLPVKKQDRIRLDLVAALKK